MRKILVIAVALVVILAVVQETSFAYEGGYNKTKGYNRKSGSKVATKAHMILKNGDELGLLDEQTTKIKELMLESKKDEIMQTAEIETIALDIKSKMWKDAVDTEAINVLIDKKYESKKVKAKATVAAYAELKNILTKKQNEKLKELYKACTEKKGESQH